MKNLLHKKIKNLLVTPSSIEVFLATFVTHTKRLAYFPTNECDVAKLKNNLLKIDSEIEIIEFLDLQINKT